MTVRAHVSQSAYRPGESAPASGIYDIEHANQHRSSHQVVLVRNTRFPACDICDRSVRYTLFRAAPFVSEDADFRVA